MLFYVAQCSLRDVLAIDQSCADPAIRAIVVCLIDTFGSANCHFSRKDVVSVVASSSKLVA